MHIREFATAIAENISVLEGQPWVSRLLRMPFLEKLGSLTVKINLVEPIFLIVQEMKLSGYSLKWLRGITGPHKKKYVYIWLGIYSTLSSVYIIIMSSIHIFDFFFEYVIF